MEGEREAVAVFFACSQRRFTGDDRHREVLRAAVMVEAGYLDTDRQVSRAVGGEHPLIELISLCVRTGRDLRRRFFRSVDGVFDDEVVAVRRVDAGEDDRVYLFRAVVVIASRLRDRQVRRTVFVGRGSGDGKVVCGVSGGGDYVCGSRFLRYDRCGDLYIPGIIIGGPIGQRQLVAGADAVDDVVFSRRYSAVLSVGNIGQRICFVAVCYGAAFPRAVELQEELAFVEDISVTAVIARADADGEAECSRLAGLIFVYRTRRRFNLYLHRVGYGRHVRGHVDRACRGGRRVAAVQIPAVCLPCDVEIHPVCGVAVAVVIIVWRQRHLDIVKDGLHRRLVAEAADRHAAALLYRHAAAHRVAADYGILGQAVYLEGEAVFGLPL